MVTYIVASKSNQPYLAECQILGEFLEKNCPDVSVKIVIKHASEWNDFLDATCRSYGFYEKTCPLVFTIEGTLIGDGASFVEHVRQLYGKVLGMTKETQKKRTHENMTMINEEMRKKQEGLTLGERVLKQIEKIKSKNVVTQLDDAFFKPEIEGDSLFHIRRTDLYRKNRTRDIPDEIAIQQQLQQELEDIEAKRDQTFEEFKFKFEDHIEGKAQNHRTARASNFGEDVKSSRSKSVKGKGKKSGDKVMSQSGNGDKEMTDADAGEHESKSQKSKRADQEVVDQINQELEVTKFELPQSCFVTFHKNTRIEKLEAKFLLCVHPHPSFEGEILLIQPKKEDQDKDDKDAIIYRDYSLRKRLPNRVKPAISAGEKLKDKKKKETEMSKLQCLEISIDEPLCQIEWVNISEVINHIKGMAWFQILPIGMKSSLPLQFNVIHFLPESKIPFDLPIDLFQKNHESNERKIERRNQKDMQEPRDDVERAAFQANAKAQGLIVIPEFDFKHVVYKLTEQNLSSEGLVYSYTKCAVFLGLKDDESSGVTMVLTSKWMLVAQLTKNYMVTAQGYPAFLDGFAYTGLVQLQEVEQVWPSTVGHSQEQKKVFESLEEQGVGFEEEVE